MPLRTRRLAGKKPQTNKRLLKPVIHHSYGKKGKPMRLPPKDVVCQCGHVSALETKKLMCVKCGKYVFYDSQEKRRHQAKTIYAIVMLAVGMGFITYLFIEMIVSPLLGR